MRWIRGVIVAPDELCCQLIDGFFVGELEASSEGVGESLTGFAIGGEDKQFIWADAAIDGDAVIVSSKEVEKPVAVRFACSKMRNWANLFNKGGLPALAFRTDDW